MEERHYNSADVLGHCIPSFLDLHKSLSRLETTESVDQKDFHFRHKLKVFVTQKRYRQVASSSRSAFSKMCEFNYTCYQVFNQAKKKK